MDYAAGIVPVGHVDRERDALPAEWMRGDQYRAMNDGARNVWSLYDADAMHGLPLAVQIVGGSLQEERTLEGMKIVQRVMSDAGHAFVPPDF